MAGDQLGWVLKLTANAEGVVNGLAKAAGAVSYFTNHAVSTTRTMTTAVNTAMQSVTGINFGGQVGQLGNVANQVGRIVTSLASGNLIGATVGMAALTGSMFAFAQQGIRAVEIHSQLGRRIGLSAQEAAGLQAIGSRFGVLPEDLQHGLQMYTERLSHLRREMASGGGGPMTDAVRRLGVEAETFVRMPIGQQLDAIRSAAASINDPMERNAMLTELLGRRGAALSPLFRASAGELANLGNAASRVGINISQDMAAGITEASRSTQRLGAVVSGVFSQLGARAGAAFAGPSAAFSTMLEGHVQRMRPFINLAGTLLVGALGALTSPLELVRVIGEKLAPVFSGIAEVARHVDSAIRQSFGAIAPVVTEAVGAIIAATSGGTNTIQSFGDMLTRIAPMIGDAIRGAGTGVLWLVRVVAQATSQAASSVALLATLTAGVTGNSQMTQMAADASNLATQMQVVANNAAQASTNLEASFTAGATGAANAAAATNVAASATQTLIAQWQRAEAMSQLSQRQREIENARQNGATEAEIARLNAADAMMTATEGQRRAWEQMAQEAQRVSDSVRSPIESFQERIADLNRLLENGLITDTAFDRAAQAAMETLERQTQQQDRGPAHAVLAGTVDEQRAIAQAERDQRQTARNPLERLERIAEQQVRRQQIQIDQMAEFLTLARDGFVDVLN